MKQTTIEQADDRRTSKELWDLHRDVKDAARAQGACFDCATRIAFKATDPAAKPPAMVLIAEQRSDRAYVGVMTSDWLGTIEPCDRCARIRELWLKTVKH